MTHLAIAGGVYLLLLALVIVFNHARIRSQALRLAVSPRTSWWLTRLRPANWRRTACRRGTSPLLQSQPTSSRPTA